MRRVPWFILLGVGGVLLSLLPANGVSVEQTDEAFITQFQLAKSRYLNARGEYLRARAQFIRSRDQFHANQESGEVVLTQAKEYLLDADQTAINYLELLRATAQTHPTVADNDRLLIVGELSQDIAWLTQKKQEIEVATTRNDLVAMGIVIREYWKDTRTSIKRISGEILSSEVDRLTRRFKISSDLISKKIDQAKSEKKDTTDLERFFQNYTSQLQSADENVNRARLQFQQIQNLEEADASFQGAHALLKEGTQALTAAHQTLASILNELSDLGIDPN